MSDDNFIPTYAGGCECIVLFRQIFCSSEFKPVQKAYAVFCILIVYVQHPYLFFNPLLVELGQERNAKLYYCFSWSAVCVYCCLLLKKIIEYIPDSLNPLI